MQFLWYFEGCESTTILFFVGSVEFVFECVLFGLLGFGRLPSLVRSSF